MERKDDCFKCQHRRDVPGDCHISCAKPDPNMKGCAYGVRSGWFFYPHNFDPVWKETECVNFEAKP